MYWNILLIWPSWSWKTTVAKNITQEIEIYNLFIADTSRAIRSWEKNWIDYNFVTRDLIIQNHKNITDYLLENYNNRYYWYNLTNFWEKKTKILTPWINVAEEILRKKEYFWFKLSILLDIDFKLFNERLQNRWMTQKEITQRKDSLNILDLKNKVDIIIDWSCWLNKIQFEIINLLKKKI